MDLWAQKWFILESLLRLCVCSSRGIWKADFHSTSGPPSTTGRSVCRKHTEASWLWAWTVLTNVLLSGLWPWNQFNPYCSDLCFSEAWHEIQTRLLPLISAYCLPCRRQSALWSLFLASPLHARSSALGRECGWKHVQRLRHQTNLCLNLSSATFYLYQSGKLRNFLICETEADFLPFVPSWFMVPLLTSLQTPSILYAVSLKVQSSSLQSNLQLANFQRCKHAC